VGDSYGAGVAGKGFALALAEKVDLRLSIFSPPGFDLAASVSSPADVAALRALAAKPVARDAASFVRGAPSSRRWLCPDDWPRRRPGQSLDEDVRGLFVAHIFFEFERLTPAEIDWLGEADLVTTASDWATRVLREHGIARVATAHQGVELDVFHPPVSAPRRPPDLDGKFLVFAGGKYEYRKGTDLAIASFAAFRQRHSDAVLVINAFNPWPWTQAGLAHSPHFRFSPIENYPQDLERILISNGIPPDGFRVLSPSPRTELAAVMAATDCGLFPIRAEGGTNHFLMEYMACGRPLVATYTTGLTDILRPGENCIALRSLRPVPANLAQPQPERGHWHEPSLEAIVAALELLYSSREHGEQLARQGLIDIQRFSWPRRADRLLELIADRKRDRKRPPCGNWGN
jgi:glycosyltransferase involved in cell wall biosynthesis